MFLCTDKYRVYFEKDRLNYVDVFLSEQGQGADLIIICDSNTQQNCLPKLLPALNGRPYSLYSFPAGEQNKTMETALLLLSDMLKKKHGRRTLIINLGGGVVSDLGGFVGSIFKRGIPFINIPTSLLGMADAAVGGKTGVDFKGEKNMLGTFTNPWAVFIWPEFLITLPQEEMRSGCAEAFKHGLIDNPGLWNLMQQKGSQYLDRMIFKSLEIKKKLVDRDPKDEGERKKLNFGHTVAHALESLYLKRGKDIILHGDAVAAGMIIESFLSWKYGKLPKEEFDEIRTVLWSQFPKIAFDESDIDALFSFMENDKKNETSLVSFVLLENIGSAVINQKLSKECVIEGLSYYLSFR
jgi:3-dehydroquinate synthase